jgi:hypothetical protein
MFVRQMVAMLMLLAVAGSASQAQDSAVVVLHIADREGNANDVRIGVHALASMGFDASLGEFPIPPVPDVPAFDIRVLDPLRQKGRLAGFDGYVDYRPLRSPAQLDTFVVRAQPTLEFYPMTFSWTPEIKDLFGQATLAYRAGDGFREIDMRSTKSVALDSIPGNRVFIVLGRPSLPASP